MEPLNHVQLMAAFIQGQRIVGRTVEGHGYPQVDVEVLDVTADLVTVRSSWGGVMHVGPNASWIQYYVCDVRKLEPSRPNKIWLEPSPSAVDPVQLRPPASKQIEAFGTGSMGYVSGQAKPKPQPESLPNVIACVTHLTPPTLFECRVLTGNWIMAIIKRLFGFEQPTDVESSLRNFGFRNGYVTFELHTEHGDDLFIRLRPEAARALAENINEGEAKQ